ncbi:U32 family peptidase [Cereibacter azotoformans]|uniref:Ubiquinone biosynthesis protein UbiU n=2 Tax=Cereibacter TaxID=1653176 RepID=A0A2T5K7T6_9RHOB|nr:peptidase U32 family protein [Cereibacter azotoformans]AXQ94259.1 U32 family peptidase [Cereibacter sphaeroides]MBO4167925.1 U32 family peptidase [Cereibacter azotoformans]PTR18487.1 putative protease [Cereibacter azotoformans]UIJ29802.1 U32 family peptidase [Cereibacter azotoformans]ULB10491.1 U32 family peptidase [Cereibacter azotoformans]
MELVCPAGTPAALRAAVEAGAHSVYCGFADETNARNFPGLNFSPKELAEGVAFAHRHGAKVLVAINTFPRAGDESLWHRNIAATEAAGADAVILADMGLLAYAAKNHPNLRRHLSVQAAAANPDIINFYNREFGVKRVVLPRVLTVAEIAAINRETPEVETEVFVFGGLCVMAEGRCSLSSYATGKSPNMNGVCSPATEVEYVEEGDQLAARLGDFTIHRVGKDQPAPYPTLCKGCFTSGDQVGHIFEDAVSLNAQDILPQLAKAGVTALKIEGRQRSRSYVAQVVRSFRAAVDALAAGQPMPQGALAALSEGQATTTGAYAKTWR